MSTHLNVVATSVFVALFALVTIMGFVAARWRKGDLTQLHEWGLGGRRFGTLVSWFLLGGDLYTAYTFIALPALLFGTGGAGFFAVPYSIVVWPILYTVLPRLWSVSHKHGYVTAADFVRGRYGSHALALAVAVTGIVATMPYIALQLVGIEVVIAGLGLHYDVALFGFHVELPLLIAFAILAAYTYTSGLRAPAMIAVVKDFLIYATVIAVIIVIPAELGGYGKIFAAVPPQKLLLASALPGNLGAQAAYGSLALGSALALFLYPHSVTGLLSSSSRQVIQRNAMAMPAYAFLLGLIALMGYMALAAGVKAMPEFAGQFKDPALGNNFVVPALLLHSFPSWFVGVAFAAIGIGALVPAAIMSIASANLFTRNIYKEYINPNCSPARESQVAKIVSLVVKLGGLIFIVGFPQTYAIQLQLLGGILIIQTLPSVLIGLYTRMLNPWALLIGWACGTAAGAAMAAAQGFKVSVYPITLFGLTIPLYAAISALILNIAVSFVLSFVFNALWRAPASDTTAEADYA